MEAINLYNNGRHNYKPRCGRSDGSSFK